jgi:Fis family transcriptional regulator, factor for inversion stimulation protein|tara:strand:+ start:449 stop:697 length:249 start_codon:yes stop_codon:yes gene_type:complete
VKELERITKNFLSEWLQKTVKKYITVMNGGDSGHLHDLVITGVEKPLLKMVLNETNGNQTQAANILGINRNTLRKKMQEYNL